MLRVPIALLALGLSVWEPPSDRGRITGRVRCPSLPSCAGAVVYIPKIEGRQYPAGESVMDQARLTFLPRVLVVVAGSRVAFPNNDDVRHNVFSASPAKRFNFGMYPRGTTKYLVFERPGVVELLCNVHAEMSAHIIVSETPFAAMVGPDGGFRIEQVPEGQHPVVAWHESMRAQRADIVVRRTQASSVEFVLTRHD